MNVEFLQLLLLRRKALVVHAEQCGSVWLTCSLNGQKLQKLYLIASMWRTFYPALSARMVPPITLVLQSIGREMIYTCPLLAQ
jgi:hypothetical protein